MFQTDTKASYQKKQNNFGYHILKAGVEIGFLN
jgi:hypothetical protein